MIDELFLVFKWGFVRLDEAFLLAYINSIVNKELKLTLSVLVISLLIASLIAKAYIPKAYVLWDEATHIYTTYLVYDTLQSGNFSGAWQNIISQILYPPLQSLIFAPLLLVSGFSINNLRTLSLLCFILSSLFVFLSGKKLGGQYVGLVSFFFFITSPMIIFYASLYMKELLGVAVSIFTVYAYFTAKEAKKFKTLRFILVGLSLFAIFLEKYQYAGLIGGAFLAEGALLIIFYRNRIKNMYHQFSMFLSFLIPALLWIILPVQGVHNKLTGIIRVLSDPWTITSNLSDVWGYILYFPRAIIYMYSPSVVVGFFLLISFFLAMFYIGNYRIRVVWFVVAINYILATNHSGNLQQRYILTTVPFLFLLGGFIFMKLAIQIQKARKGSLYYGFILGGCIIFAIIIAIDIIKMPHFIYAMASHTVRSPIFNQKSLNEEVFNYDTSSWEAEILPDTSSKPSHVLDFIASSVDLTKPVQVVGVTNEFSPNYINLVFLSHKKMYGKEKPMPLTYTHYVATIEYLPGSPLLTKDFYFMNAWQVADIRKIESDTTLTLIVKKKFEPIGVEAVVYGRR
jgi:4-amino-4-deoxy-L-arabinose transferase-like glycosyltransferase